MGNDLRACYQVSLTSQELGNILHCLNSVILIDILLMVKSSKIIHFTLYYKLFDSPHFTLHRFKQVSPFSLKIASPITFHSTVVIIHSIHIPQFVEMFSK